MDLIHRDIKTENIFLDHNFNVKLGDFGWVCAETEQAFDYVCGTLEYMSPEVLLERKYTKKLDIWSLGVLFYEMLHGNTPF